MHSEYQVYWHVRNFGCRIREFLYHDHRCVSLENEWLRIVIAADKGADILELLYKPLDLEFLWQSYNGLRPFKHYRPSSPLASGHFREYFPGGWHEMLPNGAGPCSHRCAEFGFHGEATLLPWEYRIEADTPERISVVFWVRLVRIPIYVEKRFVMQSNLATLKLEETIVSEADQPLEILWGQHPTFGWPFLERGCRIFLPRCRFCVGEQLLSGSRLAPAQEGEWPFATAKDGAPLDLSLVPGPEARSQDFIRLEDLSGGWYAIVNPGRGVGLALAWDVELLPVLGLWQVFRGALDFPWYGMNYLMALEPACDLPSLEGAVRNNRAIRLESRVSLSTTLEATVFRAPLEIHSVHRGGVVE